MARYNSSKLRSAINRYNSAARRYNSQVRSHNAKVRTAINRLNAQRRRTLRSLRELQNALARASATSTYTITVYQPEWYSLTEFEQQQLHREASTYGVSIQLADD